MCAVLCTSLRYEEEASAGAFVRLSARPSSVPSDCELAQAQKQQCDYAEEDATAVVAAVHCSLLPFARFVVAVVVFFSFSVTVLTVSYIIIILILRRCRLLQSNFTSTSAGTTSSAPSGPQTDSAKAGVVALWSPTMAG